MISKFQQEVDAFVNLLIHNLPDTDKHLLDIQSQQDEDPICQRLKKYSREGWPDKSYVKAISSSSK